jgi:uncharacterized membrane protein YeaQ/YmgE (transglycosylase-associated protein family)
MGLTGALARFLLPGRDALGCITTSLRIVGAVVGGFVPRSSASAVSRVRHLA